jgi:PrtD family type I secretion system ABC transporter
VTTSSGPIKSELLQALKTCKSAFVAVACVSAIVNVLYLTGSFYMLEVYDRVLPSRSIPTLVGISILAAALYIFQGVFDVLRGRIMVRISAALDQKLSGRVYDVLVSSPLRTRGGADGLQPLRDLDQVRSFLSSGGPLALFDLPWLPFYIAICFMFHFWLGVAALVGAVLLVAVTILTEIMTREPAHEVASTGSARLGFAEQSRRNAEVVQALGMSNRMRSLWAGLNDRYLAGQQAAGDVSGGFGAVSKVLRMMLQSAVLAVGAILVIFQEATPGIIIAGSILSARALAPAEQAIANWKGFVAARHSWGRLNELLATTPAPSDPLPLQAPAAVLDVRELAVAPPGASKPVLMDLNFQLRAGQGLGVIGPSAAGKSTLARALVGVWAPIRGDVRLDGATLQQWSPDALGHHLGYLPQDVELFAGTIASNIARFQENMDTAAVIAAGKAAGVHEMILRLPDGYDSRIGDGGVGLSAGQRQRIGLARALFGEPFLVVLDEPNSNLDAEGDAALTGAIKGVRERGGIVVVVAHRPSALANVDMVLILAEGRQRAFGAKGEVLPNVLKPVGPSGVARPAPADVGMAIQTI